MRNMTRFCLNILTGALLAASLTACGSSSSAVTSSTAPSVFYVHNVAFRNNTTFAWGNNSFGQLGVNNSTQQNLPVPVLGGGLGTPLLTGMAGVSAGGTHTLAFKNNSSVYAWGNNGFGQVGDNTVVAKITPVQVLKSVNNVLAPLSRVTGISAGGNHSLAIAFTNTTTTTSVWAWGNNFYGQLGDATVVTRLAAVQVLETINGTPLTGVTKVSAGGSHSLALRANGQVSSWGYNGFGQLAAFNNLSTLNSPVPNPVVQSDGVTPLTNVVGIAAGGSHSLFALADGTVWACGYNFLGQLGQGNIAPGVPDTKDRTHGAVPVVGLPAGIQIVAVAAGADHSLALDINGNVWAWGLNFSGQLGHPGVDPNAANPDPITFKTNIAVATPVQVQTIDPVTKAVIPLQLPRNSTIVATGNTSLAMTPDKKTVYTWGDNTFGQLGNGLAGAGTNSAYAIKIYGP
jgi:alpha-tubulin suppressor-like RCC1 family protein